MKSAPTPSIRITGAREHNLREVDLVIPRDQMVVMTGVSGSGKSSLAFDTIFAEGQRKYMESLSAYARQFLDQMRKPDVESIEGLPPTIAIEQRSGGHTPRSTVATTTEIFDYLRLLYARAGRPTCWHRDSSGQLCGRKISAATPTQITNLLIERFSGHKAMLCGPVVRGKKGFHKEIAEGLQREGFVRARVNGDVVDLRDLLKEGGENPLELGRYEMHDIEAVVDRIKIKADQRQRIIESVETALKVGGGTLLALVESEGEWTEHRFSEHFACPSHPDYSLEELAPRMFSFNSPHGACKECAGLGHVREFDEHLVIPNHDLSLKEGAVDAWRKNGKRMNIRYGRLLRKFCESVGVQNTDPVSTFTKRQWRILLHGPNEKDIKELGLRVFPGVLDDLRHRYTNTESEFVRERLHGYMSSARCPSCDGARLKQSARAVKLNSNGTELSIDQVVALTIEDAIECFKHLELSTEGEAIAAPILREVQARLGFLASVGLGYLNLNRSSGTLSGGEAQRIRLATQVGSGLVGVCYVLDEPTIGLHHRDNTRLIGTLRHLCDVGNTVLIVEHDEDVILAADHVVDVGPGPGRHGGTIIAQGTREDICNEPKSLTGDYLARRKSIEMPETRRAIGELNHVLVHGASANNLKSIDVEFPLGGIVCVSGVSGSGKSTLVNEILLKAAMKTVTGTKVIPGSHTNITGFEAIDRVVNVDQSPIGRTPRSNPATYTGVFDDIRKLFCQAAEAKIRGYQPGRFSFNVKGGRCEACQGQGVRRIEMHFLPDVFVECETCRGKRYNSETLEIRYRGKSIADVLDMTVEDAASFFDAHPKIHRMLSCVNDVGLDYMQLGQASTTLSGGEAQRVKLASELGSRPNGHTLYILDEPTTGLHFDDVRKLLGVLQRLADQGNTLVVIEHNLEVLKCADWLIDLGPEGGEGGGQILAAGTPEDVCSIPQSHTGQCLRPLLDMSATTPRTSPTATRKVSKKPSTKSTKKAAKKTVKKTTKKTGKKTAKTAGASKKSTKKTSKKTTKKSTKKSTKKTANKKTSRKANA